jgi:hypothetical protein
MWACVGVGTCGGEDRLVTEARVCKRIYVTWEDSLYLVVSFFFYRS